MSNLKISQLPEYTGNTSGSYLVMNNSGETTTYKVKKENYIFPYNGNAIITGSLTVSGSVTVSSAVSVSGSAIISGSISGRGNIFAGSVGDRTSNYIQALSKGNTFVQSVFVTGSIDNELALHSSDSGSRLVDWDYVLGNNPANAIILCPPNSGSNPIPHLQRGALISGSFNVTGSATITGSMTLAQQSTLPTGTVGSLAVSGSNLFYHNGSSWSQIN